MALIIDSSKSGSKTKGPTDIRDVSPFHESDWLRVIDLEAKEGSDLDNDSCSNRSPHLIGGREPPERSRSVREDVIYGVACVEEGMESEEAIEGRFEERKPRVDMESRSKDGVRS